MLGKNVAFSIIAPLVLMAIIAAIVIGIGETLLGSHEWAHEAFHAESSAEAAEQANLVPVAIALGIALVVLLGGSIATRLAPQVKSRNIHH
jgi:hypothetical protein